MKSEVKGTATSKRLGNTDLDESRLSPHRRNPPTKQEAERPSQPVWMLLGKEKIRLPPPKDEPRLLGLPSPSLTITAFWSVFDSLHNATDLYIRGVISLIQMF